VRCMLCAEGKPVRQSARGPCRVHAVRQQLCPLNRRRGLPLVRPWLELSNDLNLAKRLRKRWARFVYGGAAPSPKPSVRRRDRISSRRLPRRPIISARPPNRRYRQVDRRARKNPHYRSQQSRFLQASPGPAAVQVAGITSQRGTAIESGVRPDVDRLHIMTCRKGMPRYFPTLTRWFAFRYGLNSSDRKKYHKHV
jgi:hypothetical protein